jgi:hypothetical protein
MTLSAGRAAAATARAAGAARAAQRRRRAPRASAAARRVRGADGEERALRAEQRDQQKAGQQRAHNRAERVPSIDAADVRAEPRALLVQRAHGKRERDAHEQCGWQEERQRCDELRHDHAAEGARLQELFGGAQEVVEPVEEDDLNRRRCSEQELDPDEGPNRRGHAISPRGDGQAAERDAEQHDEQHEAVRVDRGAEVEDEDAGPEHLVGEAGGAHRTSDGEHPAPVRTRRACRERRFARAFLGRRAHADAERHERGDQVAAGSYGWWGSS